MQRGFTLVETLIVIAIIGVLMAVLTYNGSAVRKQALRSSALNHNAQVLSALNAWARSNPTQSLDAALQTGGFSPADFSDAPSTLTPPATAYDCAPAGSLGTYGWNAADARVRCAMYSDTSAGFEAPVVLTWVSGDDVYYLNGGRP